ncbi:MAG: hypothetical protein WB661_09390 [Candidatus Bathyarchaeia archaeon]
MVRLWESRFSISNCYYSGVPLPRSVEINPTVRILRTDNQGNGKVVIALWSEEPILFEKSEKTVRNIAELYSLITGFSFRYRSAGATGINSLDDLGKPHPTVSIRGVQTTYTKMQLRKHSAALAKRWKRTCDIWDKLHENLETSKRQYLRVALFSHYQSGLSPPMPLEDAYVNATIGLEALYNENPQDISYKLAIRGALILTASTKSTSREESHFRALKRLYNKRNAIVHGKGAKVAYGELLLVRSYLRESLRSSLALNLDKEDLISTIDDAITDQEAKRAFAQNLHLRRKALGFKPLAIL